MKPIKYTYKGQGETSLKKELKHYHNRELKAFYKEILRIRLIEEKIAERYPQDEMKSPIHLAIGQEAVSVGLISGMKPKDKVFCGHRSHAVYLAKGGNLNHMLSELHCRINGCCGSRGGSMHLLDKNVGMEGSSAIVGGAIPIATGAALAAKQKGQDHITTVFLGDAAVEEGVFWESINFAKLKNLPVLYVCENNYYSVCSPIEYRQSKDVDIYQKVKGFGLKSLSVDGNNVLEVHQTSKRLIEDIRKGKGPAFIEAHTYRWRGHHGHCEDAHLGYRSQEELEHWKQVDALQMLETVLMEEKKLTQLEKEDIIKEIEEEIQQGFTQALHSPFPKKEDLLTYVYA